MRTETASTMLSLTPFTLADFEAQHDCFVSRQINGNKLVFLFTREAERAIYLVTDYRVSSFSSGPAVWLVPVETTPKKKI